MAYNNRHHEFTEQYNHKIFMHVNGWSQAVLDYVAQLKPKIIKVLDPNVGALEQVRLLVPDALVIYRRWLPEQPLGASQDAAYQLGRDFANNFLLPEPAVQQALVDLVEGYNELLGETESTQLHKRFDRFHIGLADALDEAGAWPEPVAFNFGTGNMSGAQLLQLYPETLARYKWLGFHEYDWPTMARTHEQGLAEGNGGMWRALRYRRIMQELIDALGDNWSVVITECGMTQVVFAGADDKGWQFPDNTVPVAPWSSVPTPITAGQHFETLRWYSKMFAENIF